MRWAPACLFSALFLASLGFSGATALAAPSGARHSPVAGKGFHHGGHGFHRTRFHEVKPSGHHRHAFRPLHKHPHHRFHHHHRFAAPFWPYVDSVGNGAPIIIEQRSPAAPPVLTGIPSIADLPASTGIRSGPAGSPTFYVIDGRHSSRSGGAKIVTMDQVGTGPEARRDGQAAETTDSGPRIIHLQVPVGK